MNSDKDDTSLFSNLFYLLHENGDRLYPVRMKNQKTGRVAFRVSDQGNTLADGLEIDGEETMYDYVVNRGYAVRAATLNRSRYGLFRPGQRSIRELVVVRMP